MNPANRFLMLLNLLFFVAIIGVVIYFQASSQSVKEKDYITEIQSL